MLVELPIQGRGVLVDLEAHFGRGRSVVTHAMLMDVLARDRVAVEPGDIVILGSGTAGVSTKWVVSPITG